MCLAQIKTQNHCSVKFMCCNCEQCCLLQGSCAADLYRHPQLDADIEAVKDIYTDSAVSVRYSTDTHTNTTVIQFVWINFVCRTVLLHLPHTVQRNDSDTLCTNFSEAVSGKLEQKTTLIFLPQGIIS